MLYKIKGIRHIRKNKRLVTYKLYIERLTTETS